MREEIRFILDRIDHAALHPTLSEDQILKEIDLAVDYRVASICVQPSWVPMSVKRVQGQIPVCTVIGFPQGVGFSEVKKAEAVRALSEGAKELDMVLHVGKALMGDWVYVDEEVRALAELCHQHDALLKVILETDYLQETEFIRQACQTCVASGADFVKTSTGFGFVKGADERYSSKGAQVVHVKLIRATVGPTVGVKASGGIRSLEDAQRMIQAGANRLGTSATQKIAEE